MKESVLKICGAEVIQRQLKMERILSTVANHGRECLDILLAEQTKSPNPAPIRVVLMDIEMPVMNGLSVVLCHSSRRAS